MKPLAIISIIILQLITQIGAFTIHPITPSTLLKSTSKLYSSTPPSSVQDLLSNSSKWNPIKKELDHVPVFAITNNENQPLQYNVGGEKSFAFFFVDIDAVKAELTKAETETKQEGLKITPFPLGEIFELAAKEMAVVIPSVQGLEGAGAPKGVNPIGQQVPLFGCMDIQVNAGGPGGSPSGDAMSMTPLFFTFEEAENAMNMALGDSGGSGAQKFEVTVMPLVKAIQTMTIDEEKSFLFEAPQSSLDYLRSSMK